MTDSTKLAGAGSNTGFGTNWATPENIVADDSSYATVTNTVNGTLYAKELTSSSHGFSIPAGATIDGIVLSIKRKANYAVSANRVYDNTVSLTKNGTTNIAGTPKTRNWPTTEAVATYGSSTDLWGTTWTPSEINASTFGGKIKANLYKSGTNSTIAYVNYISITVYYTYAGVQNSQFLMFFPN